MALFNIEWVVSYSLRLFGLVIVDDVSAYFLWLGLLNLQGPRSLCFSHSLGNRVLSRVQSVEPSMEPPCFLHSSLFAPSSVCILLYLLIPTLYGLFDHFIVYVSLIEPRLVSLWVLKLFICLFPMIHLLGFAQIICVITEICLFQVSDHLLGVFHQLVEQTFYVTCSCLRIGLTFDKFGFLDPLCEGQWVVKSMQFEVGQFDHLVHTCLLRLQSFFGQLLSVYSRFLFVWLVPLSVLPLSVMHVCLHEINIGQICAAH